MGDAVSSSLALRVLVLAALAMLAGMAASGMTHEGHAPPQLALARPHLRASVSPSTTDAPFYLQEGATLLEENHSPWPFTSMSASFSVVSSLWPTAYELNALSDSNEWDQVFVTDNWPGCPSGFMFGYEVWDAAGNGYNPVCNIDGNISAGDHVDLGLSQNCATGGANSTCFSYADDTKGFHKLVTIPQLQPGGTDFLNMDSVAGAYGYFSGPMTEVVDTSANVCTQYSMPTVGYVIDVNGLQVTQFIAWSDEFELTPFQAFGCYSYHTAGITVENTPIPHYMEASGGSSYGPHWEASQDWSAVSGTPGQWRFQTDVNPLSFSIALSRTSADVGQNITVMGSVSGGAGPIQCEWTVGGIPRGDVTSCYWVETAYTSGTATVFAYAIDALWDYAEATAVQVVLPDPVVSSIVADHTTLDVGQNTSLSVHVTGGSGGYSYGWSGFPGLCIGAGAMVQCTALTVSTSEASVAVTDSNGFRVLPPRLRFTVSSDPAIFLTVSPESILAGAAWSVSVRAQGGFAPYAVAWPDLPAECTPIAQPGSMSCRTTNPGAYQVTARVTDANNVTVEASSTVRVDPSLFGLPLVSGYSWVTGVVVAALLGAFSVWATLKRQRRHPSASRRPTTRRGPGGPYP